MIFIRGKLWTLTLPKDEIQFYLSLSMCMAYTKYNIQFDGYEIKNDNNQWLYRMFVGLGPGNHINQCLNAKLICRCVFVQIGICFVYLLGCQCFFLSFSTVNAMIGWKRMSDVVFQYIDGYHKLWPILCILAQLITIVSIEHPTTMNLKFHREIVLCVCCLVPFFPCCLFSID